MIYIECDADEVLLRELGFTRKQFIHLGGKFEICKRLQKVEHAIALIEHDSGQSNPGYLLNCALIEENRTNSIHIYQHKTSSNMIVVLHNDLEDWILRIAKANKVQVSEFGLENNRNRMHRLMPGRLSNFKNLVGHLIQKDSIELKYLLEKLKFK